MERPSGPPSPRDPPSIAAMFGRIARRYDLLNSLLSLGFDRRWRERAADLAWLRPGGRALDVCAGTADLALALARRVGPDGLVVGVDFSREMLAVGKEKTARLSLRPELRPRGSPKSARRDASRAPVDLHLGDALRLPYRDRSFDAAASSFAGRNVADLGRFFSEMARVVRAGGRVAFLELGEPRAALLRRLYRWYFHGPAPVIGGIISGRRGDYRYLPQSVERFASPEEIIRLMEGAGLSDVRYVSLTLGIAGVWVGNKR